MSSSDDAIQSTDSNEQVAPSFNRRSSVSERRHNILQQKQTDHLPSLSTDVPNAKLAWRQMMQLREENKRLRWELASYEKDLDETHSNQQQEMEQLQLQVQELTEERNGAKDALVQLEHRYQELYHTFQSEVEEEAGRMVEETARTLTLTPENRPTTRTDLLKTVELHVRQAEDKHTAEALYLTRQAQRKAAQMEQELLAERQQIAIERQNIHNLQQSAREQAQLRKRMVTERLRAGYTLTLTLMTTVLLILLPIFQVMLFSFLHIPLMTATIFALFAPLLLCIVLAAIIAYFRSSTRLLVESTPGKHKEQKKA
ncbi:MAG: hypothetical protein ABI396_03600 [Ktedonobacteraceae bacterium]